MIEGMLSAHGCLTLGLFDVITRHRVHTLRNTVSSQVKLVFPNTAKSLLYGNKFNTIIMHKREALRRTGDEIGRMIYSSTISYMYLYTHTHTHTHIYIYIYI